MARRLDPQEKALWGKVIATVKPLDGVKVEAAPQVDKKIVVPAKAGTSGRQALNSRGQLRVGLSPRQPLDMRGMSNPELLRGSDEDVITSNLNSHWDRRIHRGGVIPDISIDLHDASLSRAYARLDGALEQAISQKLKVVLLVTGKPRAHDRASGEGRGAIAAVVRDWLAASRHSRHISAVRNAHPKHGGAGALYIVLKG
jgi:DNA-nicking Smr family endonuclease